MKILVVEPDMQPYVKEIDGSLKSMQRIVDGFIEIVAPYDDKVVLVCNEEGKLMDMPANAILRDMQGMPYDVIYGTFFLAGDTGEDCCSLTEEQISRYMNELSWENRGRFY